MHIPCPAQNPVLVRGESARENSWANVTSDLNQIRGTERPDLKAAQEKAQQRKCLTLISKSSDHNCADGGTSQIVSEAYLWAHA